MMNATYVMGLDLGPPCEPTGFAVIEWPATDDPSPKDPYHLRHLERFTPGAPYHEIFEAVALRTANPPFSTSPLIVDVTAVGQQVKPLIYGLKPRIIPIVVTAGQTVHFVDGVGQAVPKKDLVSTLQLALQNRRLKVAPGLEEADLLTAELQAFRLRKVSINEADALEWRVGRYDDLVFAVALACWYADQHPPQKPSLPTLPREKRDPIARLFGREPGRYTRLFPNGPYRT
jgi:hypothetical protein